MTKKNLFLTDLMKTGDHQTIEQFLKKTTLPGETMEFAGEDSVSVSTSSHCG